VAEQGCETIAEMTENSDFVTCKSKTTPTSKFPLGAQRQLEKNEFPANRNIKHNQEIRKNPPGLNW